MRNRLFLISALALWAGAAPGCNMTSARNQNPNQVAGEPETLKYADSLDIPLDRMTRTRTGLLYLDRQVGTGAVAENGKRVAVGYVGFLSNGMIFDQSAPGAPYQFVLGRGRVIDGWDEGIAGMKVGGKRLLVVRPSLAYGNASPGAGIPPNATLVFEVSLDGVQ